MRLLLENAESLAGDEVAQRRQLPLDLRRVGHQPVDGNKGGYRRENGEQRVERDACCDDRQIVSADLVSHSQQDVLPAARRDLPGTGGLLTSRTRAGSGHPQTFSPTSVAGFPTS